MNLASRSLRCCSLFFVSSAGFAQSYWEFSPARQVVTMGHRLELYVDAATYYGSVRPTHQWKHNGRLIPGANSSAYTITKASPRQDDGWYQVLVATSGGTVTSAPMFVNVAVRPAQVLTWGNFEAPPISVPGGLNDVVSVATGAGHWLALKADGTVVAWGNNNYGQCAVPADLHDIVSVAAFDYCSMALQADGTVRAWGDGSWGQLDGNGMMDVVSIAAGQAHGLALKANGTVVGWGWHLEGQASPPANLRNVVSIAAGPNNSFAVIDDGSVIGWGSNAMGNTAIPSGLTDVIEIASGEDYSVALKSNGTVVGWGNSYSGAARVPPGLIDVVSIAAGLYHAIALKSDGSVVTWGQTYTGPATQPAGATNVVAISAKDAYSAVLRDTFSGPTYTFTALAGQVGIYGSVDGIGRDARFMSLTGIAVDVAGNVYGADSENSTIRKISPDGAVTTLAGAAGQSGSADGMGASARFNFPTGIAVDRTGTVYLADAGNNLIRRVTALGEVTTLAGKAGQTGTSDGIGNAALFDIPVGAALDDAGNIYVTDTDIRRGDNSSNNTVRKVSPDGAVSTLAGKATQRGSVDGTGDAARFNMSDGNEYPGIAVDRAGNVYVSDNNNFTVRKISKDGVVTTLAGKPGSSGSLDSLGSSARFSFGGGGGVAVDRQGNVFVTDSGSIRRISPDGTVTTVRDNAGAAVPFSWNLKGIAVDGVGNLYVSGDNVIYKGVPNEGPANDAPLRSHTIANGSTVVFSADSNNGPFSKYQWTKNGAVIPGATKGTLVLTGTSAIDAGNYACLVTDALGTTTTDATMLELSSTTDVGRIVNLSARAPAGTGTHTLILGFVISGTTSTAAKPVLARAIGPSLAAFNVSGFLPDPKIEMYSGGTRILENDNWGGDSQVSTMGSMVGAFPLGLASSKDAALFQPAFAPGGYTMHVTNADGPTGVALAEIYDATSTDGVGPTTPRLVNASVRADVSTGSGVLIIGFVIGGKTSKTLLVRSVGPSLAASGVSEVLVDPELKLFSGSTLLRANDDWNTDGEANGAAFTRVGAFPLGANSKDAALLFTLPPGVYTAHVSGVGGTAGVALVELYELP